MRAGCVDSTPGLIAGSSASGNVSSGSNSLPAALSAHSQQIPQSDRQGTDHQKFLRHGQLTSNGSNVLSAARRIQRRAHQEFLCDGPRHKLRRQRRARRARGQHDAFGRIRDSYAMGDVTSRDPAQYPIARSSMNCQFVNAGGLLARTRAR